jgi:hypothetical protein
LYQKNSSQKIVINVPLLGSLPVAFPYQLIHMQQTAKILNNIQIFTDRRQHSRERYSSLSFIPLSPWKEYNIEAHHKTQDSQTKTRQ